MFPFILFLFRPDNWSFFFLLFQTEIKSRKRKTVKEKNGGNYVIKIETIWEKSFIFLNEGSKRWWVKNLENKMKNLI